MAKAKKSSWFKVKVTETRTGTFLVRAPHGSTEDEVQLDLDDANLVLGDSSLECSDGGLAYGGHYEPYTEVEAVQLRRKPNLKKGFDGRFAMKRRPGTDDELEPVVR